MNSGNEIFSISLENADLHFILHEESFVQKYSERWEKMLHTHVYYEILFSLNDRNCLIVPDRELPLSENSFAIIPPYLEHSTVFVRDDFLISVGFSCEKNNRKYLRNDVYSLFRRLFSGGIAIGEPDEGLRDLFVQLRSLHYPGDLISDGFVSAVFVQIVYSIIANLREKSGLILERKPETEKKRYSPYGVSFDTLYSVNNTLNNEFMNDITPESVSKRFFISPRQIDRYIMNQYGQTFLRRRAHLRVNAAKKLLRQSKDPIAAISRAVGYNSVNTFYSAFRKEVGMTPDEFRRKR